MAYIGNTATQQQYVASVDFFSGNASTVAFTLSRPVATVAQVQVVVANVPQNPGSAFTVSGNTVTFTSAPPTGTNNIYVYYTSPITQVIAPSAGTVGNSALANNLNINANTLTFQDGSTQNTHASPAVTVYASGSGTYITPTNAKYLTIKMAGGGGGGGGSGTAGSGNGGTGGTTTFGTSFLTCVGGVGGFAGGAGNGGAATIVGSAGGIAISGVGGGNPPFYNGVSGAPLYPGGGSGGCTAFGGAGNGGSITNAGSAASANSGSGGGGASCNNNGNTVSAAGGGGAGGYIEVTITTLLASYAYAIGAAGTAGAAAGTGGANGGAGASGVIIITAYF